MTPARRFHEQDLHSFDLADRDALHHGQAFGLTGQVREPDGNRSTPPLTTEGGALVFVAVLAAYADGVVRAEPELERLTSPHEVDPRSPCDDGSIGASSPRNVHRSRQERSVRA